MGFRGECRLGLVQADFKFGDAAAGGGVGPQHAERGKSAHRNSTAAAKTATRAIGSPAKLLPKPAPISSPVKVPGWRANQHAIRPAGHIAKDAVRRTNLSSGNIRA